VEVQSASSQETLASADETLPYGFTFETPSPWEQEIVHRPPSVKSDCDSETDEEEDPTLWSHVYKTDAEPAPYAEDIDENIDEGINIGEQEVLFDYSNHDGSEQGEFHDQADNVENLYYLLILTKNVKYILRAANPQAADRAANP
jgi:hypothetical protein